LNYLHTYDFASYVYGVRRLGVLWELPRRSEQIDVYGGTFSKTITEGIMIPGLAKGWTLRGEFAYIKGGAMNYGTDANIVGAADVNMYNYVLGFDKAFFTNWQFSTQFIQMIAEPTSPYDKRRFTLLNGATRGPLDRVETILTLLIATDFMHERLKPSVLVLYGDDYDWWVSPKVSYEINDQWLVTAGAHIFEGKTTGLSGQFDKNDQVFMELKYAF
jgi:hypothetical protein